MVKSTNRYSKLIEEIFNKKYVKGVRDVAFERIDLVSTAKKLKITLPKNLGDVIYTYRYRRPLPDGIRSVEPAHRSYRIRGTGSAIYRFVLGPEAAITPSAERDETKIPDATPGLIRRYALGDEQALLARLRYNRLVDVFLQITCYSLQNHLRTQVTDLGQVETDEIYVGVDRRGVHYIIPVQAKGGSDILSAVQIEQDFALCAEKFESLVCRAIAAQFLGPERIAMFELEPDPNGFAVVTREEHYLLVPEVELTKGELSAYQRRQFD